MRKRRILSFLLSASLIVSSIPLTALAADGNDISSSVRATTENWVTGEGTPVAVRDEVSDGAELNEYITVSRFIQNDSRATFTNPTSAKLTSGEEYTFTVSLRRNKTVNAPNDMTARIGINGTELTPRSVITEEWADYTYKFTAASTAAIKIQFWRFWTAGDLSPIDIDNISITDKNGNELIGDYLNRDNWTSAGYSQSLTIERNTETKYYAAKATEVYNSVEGILAPGRYAVKGEFRIGIFDFSKIAYKSNGYDATDMNQYASISASHNGAALYTAAGTDKVDLTTTSWTTASFILDAETEVDIEDIKFTINGSDYLDFRNVEFELTQAYVYDSDWTSENGLSIMVSPDARKGDDDNAYVHVSGRTSNAWLNYIDNSHELTSGKTYEVGFWARATDYVNAPAVNPHTRLRMAYQSGWSNIFFDPIELTGEWAFYSKQFTSTYTGATEFLFRESSRGQSVGSFDIDGLYVREVVGGVVGTTEYATNGGKVFDGTAGFRFIGSNGGAATFTDITAEDYSTAKAPMGTKGTNTITWNNFETLEKGVYKVSGDVRLSAADYNKITVSGSNVSENSNTSELSMSMSDETFDITTEWTHVEWALLSNTDFIGTDISLTLIDKINGDALSFDFKNFEVTLSTDFTADFVNATGTPVRIVNDVLNAETGSIGTAQSNEYTTIYNTKSATSKATFNATASITAGETYTLSVWLRKHNAVNEPDAAVARIAINGTEVERLTLNENWTKYTRTFTAASTTDALSLTFWRLWNPADVAPFDVDGISITDKDGTEIITGGTWTVAGYTNPVSLLQNVVETPYLHSDCPEVYATSGRLEAGIYHVTGDFRLGEFDYNKVEMDPSGDYTADNNAGSLSVVVDGVSLKNEDGSTAVDLKAIEWTTLNFVLKVGEEGMDVSGIKYIIDGAGSFDFKNVTIIEASKLYLDSWASEDGDPIRAVNKVLNTSNGTIGEASHNTYISVSNRSVGDAGAAYADSSVTLEEGKTYKLSLWMKLPEIKDLEKDAQIRIVVDDAAWSDDVISNPGANSTTPPLMLDGSFAGVSARVAGEWQKYTIVFTETENEPLFIRFRSGTDGNTYPFDIDGLSLVEVEADGEGGYTVIGDELIRNGDSLSSTMGWSKYTFYNNGPMSAEVALAEEFPYYSVNSPISGNTSIVYTGEPIAIEPGIYHIKGNFRLGSLDLTGENNRAELSLTATDNRIQLSAINGKTSTGISTDWTEVTFVLETAVAMDIANLNLMLDGTYDLDFDNISIELVERKISLSDVNTGYVMTLLLLKKAYAPKEGEDINNLIYSAIRDPKLHNWSYGEQTLKQYVDADGVNVLSASDLTDNMTGFTYTPGTTLKYGTYRFSGEFRTTNPGEKTNLRVNVSGKQGSVIVTNEWTKFEFYVELAKDAPLVVKVYGGPILNNTQDFEMRNFRLDDLAANPVAQKLYSVTFDKNADGWSTGGQGAGTFTWKTEEDGNGYMTVSDRASSSIPACIDVNLKLIPKATYVFSWDVRATNPGETSRVRFGIGWTPFILDAPSDPAAPSMVLINSEEWTHVSATYVATGNETLNMLFMTGPSDGENISFDMDNFKIERILGVRYEIYPAGDFDNEATALIGWSTGGQGAGTIIWQQEEDGNGYIQIADRGNAGIPLYRDFGFKTEAGKKYKISYDIKTVKEGETMTARASVGWSLIATQYGSAAFTVTNEWQHIESYYTAESATNFSLMFRSGSSGLDINDFAIDNLVIEEVE